MPCPPFFFTTLIGLFIIPFPFAVLAFVVFAVVVFDFFSAFAFAFGFACAFPAPTLTDTVAAATTLTLASTFTTTGEAVIRPTKLAITINKTAFLIKLVQNKSISISLAQA